ncbi:MAG: tRNA uridine-5-carboxymethylaminomethyl(34) synthesis GTPase MnmE [Rhodospirillales bacterium]|nr:tRNA uridine-5-carboxymethylaminomethyl(34) synthesis GTPase MnmE [Alphaproteobacteria bacterium]MCB1840715.1 tRNA uridine-5-carboxymethylaminomethyl(34) synthesis GTPase MnmE [Alphaproteobacteria bacterium]MCB9977573.1 tRNA uridine-5-carboxymethylaminomethyl(34) synthesis GTPase MnmE [Rhodospirillales bacterium]
MNETIFALASGSGRSGVAVVRVSGPLAFESLKTLTRETDIVPRKVLLKSLQEPVSRETIDRALVTAFPEPASYTGENVVEYSLHGSPAVVRELLDVLGRQKGHRMALPGEFTRRAFENGKMDLTEAEAVADLINAETQMQKAQALAQMEGALSRLYDGWREDLSRILAHVEAEIEFPDEDLPGGIVETVAPEILGLIAALEAHLNDQRRGERLREGISVAVVGAPNAGKSSLVNALAQRDVAIVSELAGTTRDIIEVHLDVAGYPVILSDTAGLRPEQLSGEGQDGIEAEGIRRALARGREADLRVLVYDGSQSVADPHTQALADENSLSVVNKFDLGGGPTLSQSFIPLSVKTGEGFDLFLKALEAKIVGLIGGNEAPALTRQRHREALTACVAALRRSLEARMPELLAEDLRLAIRDLGRITGRVDIEDLLDIVFRDFCIGK